MSTPQAARSLLTLASKPCHSIVPLWPYPKLVPPSWYPPVAEALLQACRNEELVLGTRVYDKAVHTELMTCEEFSCKLIQLLAAFEIAKKYTRVRTIKGILDRMKEVQLFDHSISTMRPSSLAFASIFLLEAHDEHPLPKWMQSKLCINKKEVTYIRMQVHKMTNVRDEKLKETFRCYVQS